LLGTSIVETIESAARLLGQGPTVCAIGVFDGVHIGHRKLLQDAIEESRARDAASLVFTFRNHPLSVLAPAYAPPLLDESDEKMRRIQELGPTVVLAKEFDHRLADIEPEAFVEDVLVGQLRAVSIWCGSDFRFGREGRGTVRILEQVGGRFGLGVRNIEPVRLHGHVVSSTLVRSLIEDGAVGRAAECLGRWFSLRGEVQTGDGRGADLGYPTANLEPPQEIVLPGDGVYVVLVDTRDGRNGGMVSLGSLPTFDVEERRLEVHLLDFKGDLVGEILTVHFVERLRDIERFDSARALSAQIRTDEQAARRILEKHDNDR
jgi:riboflavin kinase/FMN adenylyltransferase